MRKYWKISMLLSASKPGLAKASFWEWLVGSQLLGSADDPTSFQEEGESPVECAGGYPLQEVLGKTATLAGCPWPPGRALSCVFTHLTFQIWGGYRPLLSNHKPDKWLGLFSLEAVTWADSGIWGFSQ